MSKRTTSKTMTLEEAMARLDEINRQLRSGDQPLQTLLTLYEEGIRLYREASEQLEAAQMQIELITQQAAEPAANGGAGTERPSAASAAAASGVTADE